MENKYFTPDIEDICIGYECEKKCNIIGAHSIEVEQVWLNYTIHYDKDFTNIENDIVDYRVPYLTKEQIEDEGWKYDLDQTDGTITFVKKVKGRYYELHFNSKKKEVLINHSSDSLPFKCKDINTFRKIIKLLGI